MAFKMKPFSGFKQREEDKLNKLTEETKQDTFAETSSVVLPDEDSIALIKEPELDWMNPEDRKKMYHANPEIKRGGVDPDMLMAMNPIGSIGVGIKTIGSGVYNALFGEDEENKS